MLQLLQILSSVHPFGISITALLGDCGWADVTTVCIGIVSVTPYLRNLH